MSYCNWGLFYLDKNNQGFMRALIGMGEDLFNKLFSPIRSSFNEFIAVSLVLLVLLMAMADVHMIVFLYGLFLCCVYNYVLLTKWKGIL